MHPLVRQFEDGGIAYMTSEPLFFTHDEVALLRFMEICQETCDPDNYRKFLELSEYLISIRPGLHEGCFERIENYLSGKRQSIASPES